MKRLFFAILFLVCAGWVFGATRFSVVGGSSGTPLNWNTSSTWVGGTVPNAGDTAVIVSGAFVRVTANVPASGFPYYDAVIVRGSMQVSNGVKVDLINTGYVEVESGGSINGGNPGTKFEFRNSSGSTVTSVNGSFSVSGPSFATSSSGGFVGGVLPVSWEAVRFYDSSNWLMGQWVVSSEKDCAGYQVEGSTDGNDWSLLGKVDARAGIEGRKTYQWKTSMNNARPFHYFRVVETGLNGKQTYSEIQYLKINNTQMIKVTPNPFNNTLALDPEDCSIPLEFSVFDQTGRVICKLGFTSGLQERMEIDTRNWGIGIYHVVLSSENFNHKWVFVKNDN